MSDFINPSDFETFLQLDDLKGNFAQDLEKFRAENPKEDYSEDDYETEDDSGDEDYSIDRFANEDGKVVFEGEDGWKEPEEEEGEAEESEDEGSEQESDEVDEGSQETEDEGEVEYEEGEAFDVDYETVITLPDGRDMTIEELANGYLVGNELTQREEQLQQHIGAFEERVSGLKDVLNLAQLEADKVISDYEGFDWETLAAEDPQAYVENKRFLERYQARRNDLVAAQNRIQAEVEAKAQQEFQTKCAECVNILKREIPNWDEALYQNLMQYAVELGAVEDEILKENRPSVFLALHKAYQFDKGKQAVMAKIKKPGAPKKVVKAGAKTQPSQTPDNAKAARAFSEGRMSTADAFKYLVD